MTTTSSVEVQLLFVIVQRKVYAPATEAVAVEVGEVALPKVTVPGPLIFVHAPVPTLDVLPASVAAKAQTL